MSSGYDNLRLISVDFGTAISGFATLIVHTCKHFCILDCCHNTVQHVWYCVHLVYAQVSPQNFDFGISF